MQSGEINQKLMWSYELFCKLCKLSTSGFPFCLWKKSDIQARWVPVVESGELSLTEW